MSPFLPCDAARPASLLSGSSLCVWLASAGAGGAGPLGLANCWLEFLQLTFACQEGSMDLSFCRCSGVPRSAWGRADTEASSQQMQEVTLGQFWLELLAPCVSAWRPCPALPGDHGWLASGWGGGLLGAGVSGFLPLWGLCRGTLCSPRLLLSPSRPRPCASRSQTSRPLLLSRPLFPTPGHLPHNCSHSEPCPRVDCGRPRSVASLAAAQLMDLGSVRSCEC